MVTDRLLEPTRISSGSSTARMSSCRRVSRPSTLPIGTRTVAGVIAPYPTPRQDRERLMRRDGCPHCGAAITDGAAREPCAPFPAWLRRQRCRPGWSGHPEECWRRTSSAEESCEWRESIPACLQLRRSCRSIHRHRPPGREADSARPDRAGVATARKPRGGPRRVPRKRFADVPYSTAPASREREKQSVEPSFASSLLGPDVN